MILLRKSKSISYGGIIRIRYKGRRSYLPLSLSYKLPCIFSCKRKTGETFCGFSCKKSLCMTSYGGIIRIRLRVEVG